MIGNTGAGAAMEVLYVCVDDTDDLTKETSTGSVSEEIARRIELRYGSKMRAGITRHQLLLDRRVPYTSHNSSMCFDTVVPQGSAGEVAELAWGCIDTMRAATSNPGLCVWSVPPGLAVPSFAKELVEFGVMAKSRYVDIEEARHLAKSVPGLLLQGKGETAQGMVGALAGVGLRFGGDDGRFRGKWDMTEIADGPSQESSATVVRCVEWFAESGIDARFVDAAGSPLVPDAKVILISDAKPVLRGGSFTIVCEQKLNGMWKPCTKKSFAANMDRSKKGCELFELDPDAEEHLEEESLRSCGSCLYRIFSQKGITCSKKVLL